MREKRKRIRSCWARERKKNRGGERKHKEREKKRRA
jgi:hypothetical protein